MTKIDLFGKLELDNKKLMLIVIVWIVIIYIDFTYLMKMQLNSFSVSGKKVVYLKRDIADLNKELAQLKDSQGNLKDAATKKARRIIKEEQMPDLLQKITEIANNNKVVVTKIDPSREQKTKEATVVQIPGLSPIFIALDLVSDYHSLGSFIAGLENMEEFVAVQDFYISRQDKDYFKEKTALVLRTYVAR